MNVVVTGACGFIGMHTCIYLKEKGYSVTGIDLAEYDEDKMKVIRYGVLAGKGIEVTFLHSGSLDYQSVATSVKCEAIVHLGALAGAPFSETDHDSYFKNNVIGTYEILEFARKVGCKRFLMASTSSVYGGAKVCEPGKELITKHFYGTTKAAAEKIALGYLNYGIDVGILRFFTVFGTYGRPDMSIFRFIHNAKSGKCIEIHGDGLQERMFTHIDFLVKRISLEINKSSRVPVANVCGEMESSIINLASFVGRRYGAHLKFIKHPFEKLDVKGATPGYPDRKSISHELYSLCDWFDDNWVWLKNIELPKLPDLEKSQIVMRPYWLNIPRIRDL